MHTIYKYIHAFTQTYRLLFILLIVSYWRFAVDATVRVFRFYCMVKCVCLPGVRVRWLKEEGEEAKEKLFQCFVETKEFWKQFLFHYFWVKLRSCLLECLWSKNVKIFFFFALFFPVISSFNFRFFFSFRFLNSLHFRSLFLVPIAYYFTRLNFSFNICSSDIFIYPTTKPTIEEYTHEKRHRYKAVYTSIVCIFAAQYMWFCQHLAFSITTFSKRLVSRVLCSQLCRHSSFK